MNNIHSTLLLACLALVGCGAPEIPPTGTGSTGGGNGGGGLLNGIGGDLFKGTDGGHSTVDAGTPGTPGTNPATTEFQSTFLAAHAGPQVVAYDGSMLSVQLVSSVTAAYYLTNQVVTTGTVTWTGAETATYSATPTDRLIVINAQGHKAEFLVKVINATNPQDFFKGNWALDFHVLVAGAADLDILAQSVGGQFTSSARGTVTTAGTPSTIDVSSSGSTYFESDSSGSEYRNSYRLTGTLKRGAITRTVDEQWTFRMIVSRSNNKTTSASDAVRVDNGSLVMGADSYKWNNCRTAKAFTNGKPSQDTFWKAQCDSITKNGQPFGQYRAATQQFGQAGGFITFFADFANGTSVELEKWAAY
jgi:hypothetical protein